MPATPTQICYVPSPSAPIGWKRMLRAKTGADPNWQCHNGLSRTADADVHFILVAWRQETGRSSCSAWLQEMGPMKSPSTRGYGIHTRRLEANPPVYVSKKLRLS